MRVELQGDGEPIQLEAMPDANLEMAGSAVYLVLPAGIFNPQPYLDLGFTNYQVLCVGAAGGNGGDGFESGVTWPYQNVGGVQHWHDPYLAGKTVWGGGGGGGGLHVVSGLLVDLPTDVVVEVGQAGADSAGGYLRKGTTYEDIGTPWTPDPPSVGAGYVYDDPHLTFYPPDYGGDGGASSFNGAMCKASGGKGGAPAARKVGTDLMIDGQGGQGGAGNRVIPGGGGAGSSTEDNGSDGTWDGVVGQGGGGGRGGTYIPPGPQRQMGV